MHRTSFLTYASACGVAFAGTFGLSACARGAQTAAPDRVEQQYGAPGAFNEAIAPRGGSFDGAVLPVTLPDGRRAVLVVPGGSFERPPSGYTGPATGVRAIQIGEQVTSDDLVRPRATAPVRTRRAYAQRRTWQEHALIVGGSAGAGAVIGAVAGGGKGAAIGATAGGIAGLVYDLASRGGNKRRD